MKRVLAISALALLLTACDTSATTEPLPPTATLAPQVSQTPRFTATPIPSRTPLPTQTPSPTVSPIPPTPSQTFTPSPTPPVMGSVASLQDINVREGPGVQFSAFIALRPGTEVVVLGQNEDGEWLNVRLEAGEEGWVAADLIRLRETPTPIPTLTPTPDLTALALGTPLPTALLGGGTITPTPPLSIVTPTLAGQVASAPTSASGLPLPDLTTIEQTGTALAGGLGLPTVVSGSPAGGPTGGPLPGSSATAAAPVNASTRAGVDVLAYCDDPSQGAPPPNDLAAGSSIDIYWSWYARTEAQVRDHIEAAVYEVRLDGQLLSNWRQYTGPIELEEDGNYWVYWFVPSGPLTSGQHRITYSVSWTRAIDDGYAQFGPGTGIPSQAGSCSFVVR